MNGSFAAEDVDHINRDKSDNRWTNLRPASRQQNEANKGLISRNTSGHRGVSWCPRVQKWKAQCRVDGALIFLGHFEDPVAAGKKAAAFRLEKFGIFALDPYTKESG